MEFASHHPAVFVQQGGDHGLCKAKHALFRVKGATSRAFLKQDSRWASPWLPLQTPCRDWSIQVNRGASWGSETPGVSVQTHRLDAPYAPQLLSRVKLPAQAGAVTRPESERDRPTFQAQLCLPRPHQGPRASASSLEDGCVAAIVRTSRGDSERPWPSTVGMCGWRGDTVSGR